MSPTDVLPKRTSVAMVVSIGTNGEIVRIADADGKKLESCSNEKMEGLIRSATKSTCRSINIQYLEVNPKYVSIYVGGRWYLVQVE